MAALFLYRWGKGVALATACSCGLASICRGDPSYFQTAPDSPTPSAHTAVAFERDDASPQPEESRGAAAPSARSPSLSDTGSTSGNPAAVNVFTGIGTLGEVLGLSKTSPVRLGGAWLGDGNWLMSGGLEPGSWTGNSLTLLSVNADAEKALNWQGGLFGIEFLQLTAQPTNEEAGVVQGYNSLPGPPPLVRQEIYNLWWRQEYLDGRLNFRVGKQVPTIDFGNVVNPNPTDQKSAQIPAVTGLIFTPVFINPAMLGPTPGYYNSSTGIATSLLITEDEQTSVRYGFYDGNLANGEQTGLRGPQFNGYYYNIWEVTQSWTIGIEEKPGKFGMGFWYQTGKLTAANGARVDGANGFYLFGAQRLWFRHPGEDNSGVSGYYQFGCNNSNTMLVRQFFGGGLTAFNLVPNRPKDTMGCGFAWGLLNRDPHAGSFFYPDTNPTPTSLRSNELMFQGYYQAHLFKNNFFEQAVSFIPNPGQNHDIDSAWAWTFRFISLF